VSDSTIAVAISRLDAWLDAMRGSAGYGGPVAHWWRDSLLFCGAGLDWRYEGIIRGYVTLFDRTGDPKWLAKARRAGDDLVSGQLPDGRFRNSSFERNPLPGGTPHEAAADIGLLVLVSALRSAGHTGWEAYFEAAERNLVQYHIGWLWNDRDRRFSDGQRAFVPNKAATIIEAMCHLAGLTGDAKRLDRLVGPTADAILAHQVRLPGSELDGAISQATVRGRKVDQFFPFYVARCIPGLVAAYQALGAARYLDAARASAEFLDRTRDQDGGCPQILYRHGRVNRYPRWVAAAGDIIRILELIRPLGIDIDVRSTTRWLLAGQLPTGAIRVAEGFTAQVRQRASIEPPDVRELLPVVGWNDKALHGLATLVPPGMAIPAAQSSAGEFRTRATWRSLGGRGRSVLYREDTESVEVVGRRSALYRWRKGESWARVRDPNRQVPMTIR
jgi:hypothetical protein